MLVFLVFRSLFISRAKKVSRKRVKSKKAEKRQEVFVSSECAAE